MYTVGGRILADVFICSVILRFNSFHFSLIIFRRYDEISNNCYDFALSFLNELLPLDMKPKLEKANFCKDFILPWTTKAACYIDLFRRVKQRGGISVEKNQRRHVHAVHCQLKMI